MTVLTTLEAQLSDFDNVLKASKKAHYLLKELEELSLLVGE